jgi:hypothetical protein
LKLPLYFEAQILKIMGESCYKELLDVDIHTLAWISTPERGCPRPGVDVHTSFILMSKPGRGYPSPGMDVHAWAWKLFYSRGK